MKTEQTIAKTTTRMLWVGLISVAIGAAVASAATPGTDNAANSAYSGGWTDGSDGGAPTFGPWSLVLASKNPLFGITIYPTPFVIATGSSTGTGGGDINTSGKTFLIRDVGPQPITGISPLATATRSFDSALTVGQDFSLDLAINILASNYGFNLSVSGGTGFSLSISPSGYTVTAATGSGPLFGNALSQNTTFHLDFVQTSLAGGSWTVTRGGTLTGTASGTYSGDIIGFALSNDETGRGSGIAANNFAIVPEPTTVSLLLGSLLLSGAIFLVRGHRFGSGTVLHWAARNLGSTRP